MSHPVTQLPDYCDLLRDELSATNESIVVQQCAWRRRGVTCSTTHVPTWSLLKGAEHMCARLRHLSFCVSDPFCSRIPPSSAIVRLLRPSTRPREAVLVLLSTQSRWMGPRRLRGSAASALTTLMGGKISNFSFFLNTSLCGNPPFSSPPLTPPTLTQHRHCDCRRGLCDLRGLHKNEHWV